MNSDVILKGRVFRPEAKHTKNGGMMYQFTIACYAGKDKQANTYHPSLFFDCLTFDALPPEGGRIIVEGRFQYESWTDKTTGELRSKHKVIVNSWHTESQNPAPYSQQQLDSLPF